MMVLPSLAAMIQQGNTIASTPWDLIAHATPVTKVILIILAAFSLFSWVMIFWKWSEFRRLRAPILDKDARARTQFGQALAEFQLVQEKLGRMAIELTASRLLVYRASWEKDGGADRITTEAAMAKLYCSEVMYRAANHAVQLHGGYGLMKEYDVERFYRDQKLLDIGEGTSEVQRIVIARHIGARCL